MTHFITLFLMNIGVLFTAPESETTIKKQYILEANQSFASESDDLGTGNWDDE